MLADCLIDTPASRKLVLAHHTASPPGVLRTRPGSIVLMGKVQTLKERRIAFSWGAFGRPPESAESWPKGTEGQEDVHGLLGGRSASFSQQAAQPRGEPDDQLSLLYDRGFFGRDRLHLIKQCGPVPHALLRPTLGLV
jgi:hypothetical protein